MLQLFYSEGVCQSQGLTLVIGFLSYSANSGDLNLIFEKYPVPPR